MQGGEKVSDANQRTCVYTVAFSRGIGSEFSPLFKQGQFIVVREKLSWQITKANKKYYQSVRSRVCCEHEPD
jgi:hypothetical protein